MIRIAGRPNSEGLRAVIAELQTRGCEVSLVPPGAPSSLQWGRGGGNKYQELVTLRRARVRVPDHWLSGEEPTDHAGLLARTFRHSEARDLLKRLKRGDYWVRYTPTIHEFRVHVFKGRVIRTGLKVPRTARPHPKFRSWKAGWKLDYGGACQALINDKVRDLARKAVKALGYLFGAVDIGVLEDGTPIVWEVNSRPGLEGNTVKVYARHIATLAGEENPNE